VPAAKGYVLVEGHGDVGAAANLVHRLWTAAGGTIPWATPLRWKNLHQREGVGRGAGYIRHKGDAGALLLLRDEDDACPRERGPEIAAWLRELDLPFPAAVVLLHPEFEVLFLPCLPRMAGRLLRDGPAERPGLEPGTEWQGDWQAKRGIKEWLTAHFPANRSYKPTQDQLPLTRMIDLDDLRDAALPCFGTLERALGFLQQRVGRSGTYP
jgi:hypothetical protein